MCTSRPSTCHSLAKRIPAVISRRLSNFRPGYQQYDYPMHTLRVESGPQNHHSRPQVGAETPSTFGYSSSSSIPHRPAYYLLELLLYHPLQVVKYIY